MSHMTEQEREAIRAQVRAGRIAQGLPPTIEDPVLLAQIAALLLEPDEKPEQDR
jgi:hypothetical protein